MLTLFKSVTGGVTWDELTDPMERGLGELYQVLFVVYIVVAALAVLNVATSMFCQSAIESAQHDMDMMTQRHIQNKSKTVKIR